MPRMGRHGKWGLKQRRVYELDEDGNRTRDADGSFVFNAVPTTDWGSAGTLEHWNTGGRRGRNCATPSLTVRATEKKGIRTKKGEFNRWIRATNAVIRDIKNRLNSGHKSRACQAADFR